MTQKSRIFTKAKYSRSAAGNLFNLLFLLIMTVFMFYPLMYTFTNAFKPTDELFIFPPKVFVSNPTLANFVGIAGVMRDSVVPLGRYIINSVWITSISIIGSIIFASMAAYMLSREVFPGKNLLNKIVVLSLMFSPTVLMIPRFIIMARMGIINTNLTIILPAFASSLGLFLMKQFMDQMIPMSLLEAARIDGAGEMRIFLRIVMPLCKPAWLTLLIFTFKDVWSNTGYLYVFDDKLKTLPYALNSILNQASTTTGGYVALYGVSMAVGLIIIIPPLVISFLAQSNVLETMSTSGLKE